MSDGKAWRDLHRASGKFLPRPGAKGFREKERPPMTPTAKWAERTAGKREENPGSLPPREG